MSIFTYLHGMDRVRRDHFLVQLVVAVLHRKLPHTRTRCVVDAATKKIRPVAAGWLDLMVTVAGADGGVWLTPLFHGWG